MIAAEPPRQKPQPNRCPSRSDAHNHGGESRRGKPETNGTDSAAIEAALRQRTESLRELVAENHRLLREAGRAVTQLWALAREMDADLTDARWRLKDAHGDLLAVRRNN